MKRPVNPFIERGGPVCATGQHVQVPVSVAWTVAGRPYRPAADGKAPRAKASRKHNLTPSCVRPQLRPQQSGRPRPQKTVCGRWSFAVECRRLQKAGVGNFLGEWPVHLNSCRSRVVPVGRATSAAERRHQHAANCHCRPMSDSHCFEITVRKPPIGPAIGHPAAARSREHEASMTHQGDVGAEPSLRPCRLTSRTLRPSQWPATLEPRQSNGQVSRAVG